MVFLADFVFVLIFATVAMVVLAATSARYRAWPTAIWFFVLILLGTWALGAWFEPVGFPVAGTYWLSFAIAAVLLTLVVAAVSAAAGEPQSGSTASPGTGLPEEEVPLAALGCAANFFFWLFIFATITAVIVSYL